MKVLESFEAVRGAIGAKVACLVPTMGFLHEGHRSLMERSVEDRDVTVASIFVNPLQFAPGEDLSRYPRDARGDLSKCRGEGVDVVLDEQTLAAGHELAGAPVVGFSRSLAPAASTRSAYQGLAAESGGTHVRRL